MSSPRILGFGWNERLIAVLSRLGGTWDVVPRVTVDREAPWRLARRLPSHMSVVTLGQARASLTHGRYDLAVCQALPDLEMTGGCAVPTVCVVTGTPAVARTLGVYAPLHARLTSGDVTPMFLSDHVQREWQIDGVVVPLGLDVDDYGPYRGDRPGVLVVAPLGLRLPSTAGVAFVERATAGLPVTWVDGPQPDRPDRGASGRPWLLDAFASHRVLLDAAPAWCRSGAHHTVLEAMATGQPVVTVPKPGCLITDGVNGYVDDDPRRLHQRILQLMGDQTLAADLGREARRTIATAYPTTRSVAAWRRLLRTVRRVTSTAPPSPGIPVPTEAASRPASSQADARVARPDGTR